MFRARNARDTEALHAKLDALFRATGAATGHLTIDEKEPEEIE